MAQNGSENGYGYGNSNGKSGIYSNAYDGYGGGMSGGIYGGNAFFDLTDILWKRRFGMFVVFLLVFGIAVALTLSQTPVYQVAASMMVKYGREFTYHAIDPTDDDDVRPMLTYQNDETISTMLEVFKSSKVIEAVLNKQGIEKLFPKLAEKRESSEIMPIAINAFRGKLDVSHIIGSKVISIKFNHSDPQPAVDAVKLLTEEFKNRHLELSKNPRTSILEKQAEILLQKYVDATDAVTAFKKDNGVHFIESQQRVATEELMYARGQMYQQKATFENMTQKLASSEETLKNMPEVEILYGMEGEDSNFGYYQTKLLELQLKESNLLRVYPEDNRLVKETREQIKITKDFLAKISAERGNPSRSSHSGKSFAYNQLESSIVLTSANLKGAQASYESVQKDVAKLEKRLTDLTAAEYKLKRLELLAQNAEANYKKVLQNLEENRLLDMLDEEKLVSIVDIETPVRPLTPIKPKKRVNIMVGMILAAASAFAYAIIFEFTAMKKKADAEL